MSLFFLLYFIIIAIHIKNKGYRLLINPLFWLGVFWVLIFGVYFTSGIRYKYGLSIWLCLFLIACIYGFLVKYRKGLASSVRTFVKERKVAVRKWLLIGLFGTILYIFDYLRLNGFNLRKTTTETSFIGTLGALMLPILLVIGIYLNCTSIRNKGKFHIGGIALMFLYGFPCIMNAGREAFLFIVIGMISLLGYRSILSKTKEKTKTNNTKMKFRTKLSLIIVSGIFLVGALYVIFLVSVNRFTDNEINSLLAASDMSSKSMNEASSWGIFEFLYYNIASYFSHQIPFLDQTLQEYRGPFLGGLFELNIISRRLPDFLGLDYNLAFMEEENIFNRSGESFAGGWNTVIGSFIIDFTWIGAIIACSICGYYIGVIQKKFIKTKDSRYATLLSLVCLCSFSTIQLGPFFQTNLYSSFIWWYILFHRYEKKISKNDSNNSIKL